MLAFPPFKIGERSYPANFLIILYQSMTTNLSNSFHQERLIVICVRYLKTHVDFVCSERKLDMNKLKFPNGSSINIDHER